MSAAFSLFILVILTFEEDLNGHKKINANYAIHNENLSSIGFELAT